MASHSHGSSGHAGHGHEDDGMVHAHIAPVPFYLGVFVFLTNEDQSTRNRYDQEQDAHYLATTGQIAPGGVSQETMNRLVGVAPAGSAAGAHGGGHGAAPGG